MTRDSSGRQTHLRERIAHLAARIMAEDGIDDFGYAKRKAARQAGAVHARAMPDNEEIERALAAYRALYQPGRHQPVLAALRGRALEVMRLLERYSPYLTGSVLSGVAGRNSDIELQVFVDSAKEVEIFLLNRNVKYRAEQVRLFLNQAEKVAPTFSFEHGDANVRLTVLDARDIRQAIRTSAQGRPLERASIMEVEQLVQAQ